MTAEWNFLAFKNRHEGDLTQPVSTSDGAYNPIVFGSQAAIVDIRFQMSLEEFTKVYTSVTKGAILSYPDESESVIWSFLRNFEFPIEGCMSCADVQDCIENDEGTRETIQDLVQQGTGPGGGVMGGSEDLSALFGSIRFLVDTMHDAIVDVFEIQDDASDLRTRATLLFSAIPGAQLLPFDEGANYIQSLLEDVGEQFAGQWTTTPITGSRDRISCGLFCLAKDNGNALTWDLVRDWFWEQVSFESPGLNQFLDFAVFLSTGSWAGQDVVNISFANFAAAMDASGRYGELLFPSMSGIMRLGQNDPDPDYETLCEECNPPAEPRAPVIGSIWDPAHTAGTIEGPDETGFYTVTSGTRASDEAFSIMDEEERDFVLVDIEYDEVPACQEWGIDGNAAHLACGVGNQYVDQVVDEFITTWASGAHRQMRFKMVAPE